MMHLFYVDAAVIWEYVKSFQNIFKLWNLELENHGIKLNVNKSMRMMVSRKKGTLFIRVGDSAGGSEWLYSLE